MHDLFLFDAFFHIFYGMRCLPRLSICPTSMVDALLGISIPSQFLGQPDLKNPAYFLSEFARFHPSHISNQMFHPLLGSMDFPYPSMFALERDFWLSKRRCFSCLGGVNGETPFLPVGSCDSFSHSRLGL